MGREGPLGLVGLQSFERNSSKQLRFTVMDASHIGTARQTENSRTALNISCFILLSFDQVQSVGTAPSSEIKVTELLNVLLLERSLIRHREVRRIPS